MHRGRAGPQAAVGGHLGAVPPPESRGREFRPGKTLRCGARNEERILERGLDQTHQAFPALTGRP